jgi:hypothetical protein
LRKPEDDDDVIVVDERGTHRISIGRRRRHLIIPRGVHSRPENVVG